MKTKIKILRSFISAIFIFIILITSVIPVSAGLVNLNSGNSYLPVSIYAGNSVSVPVYDEIPPLSPAVNIIRNNIELKKPALINSEITFKPDEFEKILGIKKLNSITITKLPDLNEGVLTLAGSDILEGQTISRENIQYIRLVPYPNRTGTINFYFKNSDDITKNASLQCVVSVLDTIKFAPAAKPVNLTTQKNIPVFKSMNGIDPDNSDIYYKIIKGPKNGFLEVLDETNGSFIYRPKNNYTGNDSFIYQVEDIYGNISNPATAQIKITKAASNIKFTDMFDMFEHWAANSAVKAVAAGFIDVDINNPDLKFEPDKSMTRAEFVEMALRAAKLDKNMSEVYKTGFADDSDIPFKYKSYVTKAYELGVIKGISTETGVYFDPNGIITRAEAAVIVNNILKVPAAIKTSSVFIDAVFIPKWAEEDISALNSSGILNGDENGNVNPNGLLNKAQSVEILCAMIDYKNNSTKTGGIFSFLFK